MEQNDDNTSASLVSCLRGGWADNTALGKGNEPQLLDSKLQLRGDKVHFLNRQQDLRCGRGADCVFPPPLLVQDSQSFME